MRMQETTAAAPHSAKDALWIQAWTNLERRPGSNWELIDSLVKLTTDWDKSKRRIRIFAKLGGWPKTQLISFGGKRHTKSESEMKAKGEDLIESIESGAISVAEARSEAAEYLGVK